MDSQDKTSMDLNLDRYTIWDQIVEDLGPIFTHVEKESLYPEFFRLGPSGNRYSMEMVISNCRTIQLGL